MASPSQDDRSVRLLRRSVVKVLTVADPPDYEQPWQTLGATNETGSGAIVETKDGPRILTNAHVVEAHVFVEVRRYGHAEKYVASVVGMSSECDLALLDVAERQFFRGTRPISLGPLPNLGDRVSVLGFPIGGDRLSMTEGVVSRIEMTTYTQSQRSLLTIQIDAAINAGNSGGPVLRDCTLVGIAFQALEEAEDIGYVIPTTIVRHFLEDLADGEVDGFPSLCIDTQILENRAHRRALGLHGVSGGMLVTHVDYGGSSWKVLEEGDVLLAIGRTPVAGDGTVPFRKGERIDYTHEASQKHVGDALSLKVWREARRQRLEVTLTAPRTLVREDAAAERPRYFLYGGLLFVPLSRGYLETWGEDWLNAAPPHLLDLYEYGARTAARREVVVLQKVLADRINRGYHDVENVVVTRVQGKKVRDLAYLVGVVSRAKGEFVRFRLADDSEVVLDRALASQRAEMIRQRYGVTRDRSPDLVRGRRSKSSETGGGTS